MSSSAPPTTSSGSGSKNNYKGKNNKRKGNNNDKKRWGNKKQFDREAGRTNYESKNQGYSQYGPAGQDQRRGTNEDDAPHPGSYAVELYNAKKADAEAKKPDGEDVEKPDEAATMASDALRKYPKRKVSLGMRRYCQIVVVTLFLTLRFVRSFVTPLFTPLLPLPSLPFPSLPARLLTRLLWQELRRDADEPRCQDYPG